MVPWNATKELCNVISGIHKVELALPEFALDAASMVIFSGLT